MWPFLPALFLLILQGPSDFERMASGGRLPAALEALHRHLETPAAQKLVQDEKGRELLLASLLAMGADDLGKAIAELLALDLEAAPKPAAEAEPGPTSHPPTQHEEPPQWRGDDFSTPGRTRDGPAAR
jgi:hypothetical protein